MGLNMKTHWGCVLAAVGKGPMCQPLQVLLIPPLAMPGSGLQRAPQSGSGPELAKFDTPDLYRWP